MAKKRALCGFWEKLLKCDAAKNHHKTVKFYDGWKKPRMSDWSSDLFMRGLNLVYLDIIISGLFMFFNYLKKRILAQ